MAKSKMTPAGLEIIEALKEVLDDVTGVKPLKRRVIDVPEKPFTPKSLAERWGVSEASIRQMCRDGDSVAFGLGVRDPR